MIDYINYIVGISMLILGYLLSNTLNDKQIKILTLLGWLVALLFAKKGEC